MHTYFFILNNLFFNAKSLNRKNKTKTNWKLFRETEQTIEDRDQKGAFGGPYVYIAP